MKAVLIFFCYTILTYYDNCNYHNTNCANKRRTADIKELLQRQQIIRKNNKPTKKQHQSKQRRLNICVITSVNKVYRCNHALPKLACTHIRQGDSKNTSRTNTNCKRINSGGRRLRFAQAESPLRYDSVRRRQPTKTNINTQAADAVGAPLALLALQLTKTVQIPNLNTDSFLAVQAVARYHQLRFPKKNQHNRLNPKKEDKNNHSEKKPLRIGQFKQYSQSDEQCSQK